MAKHYRFRGLGSNSDATLIASLKKVKPKSKTKKSKIELVQ